jgi:hypothetical protein
MAEVLATVALVVATLLGQQPENSKAVDFGRLHPLIMLTEYNPWAMVVGSDTPSFVLYEDGTLIYRGKVKETSQYLSVKLSGQETMTLLRSIRPDELGKLEGSYKLSDFTDQPTNVLIFWTPGLDGRKEVSVYGSLRAFETRPAILPEALWSALKSLRSYQKPMATPWMPPYVEVMVWPFDYAKESANWPAQWPGLDDSMTRKHGDLYSIFINSSRLEEIKAFKNGLKPKQAVKLNNKKWAMELRFPFPHEMP